MSFTSTFSDITPDPTTSPSPSGNANSGGGGGNINNGGPSLASSASLYLYTFLATLVLLLSVSAAIVIRSFLLRRRHRRMIEEAIRNGTWVPPTPSGRTGPRVDLSKRPLMWEAYLDFHHQQQQQQQQQHIATTTSDERDWESMKPIMANYINDSSARKPPTSMTGGAAGGTALGGGGGGIGQGDTGGDRLSSARQLFQRFTHRLSSAISPNRSPSQPTSNQAVENHPRQGSNINTSGQHTTVPMTELTPPRPSKVRVAVFIAMPRPHTSPSSSTSPSTSRSASTSSSPQIPLNATTTRNPMNMPDEEEELPHIEMGVAELVVVDASLSTSLDLGRSSLSHGPPTMKGKMRESMMSYGSV